MVTSHLGWARSVPAEAPAAIESGRQAHAGITDTPTGRGVPLPSTSDSLWERMLDTAADAIVAVDASGTLVVANAQTERMFGYPRSELIGEPADVLVPQRFRGGHGAPHGRFLTAPRSRPMGSVSRLVAVARDGREFPIEVSLSSLETEQGPLVIAAIRDVSERAQAKREATARDAELRRLRESEAAGQRLRSVADGAPVGILALAPDGSELYVNPRWSELAGVDRGRCVADEWWRTVHPEDLARVRSAWQELLAGGQLATRFRFMHADGKVVSVVGSGRRSEAGGGELVISLTELTALHEADAEAAASQLAAIVASTDDAVIGKTLTGEVTSWNAAAERIYGYSATEAIGQHISFLLPPGRTDEIDSILRRLNAGAVVEHLETVRRRKDGRAIDVSLTISPVFTGDGAIVGASTIARDITEKKALARQLAASAQLLRATIDHAPIGMSMTSLDGRLLQVNPALCQMTGYSEADLLALDYQAITHPDDVEESVSHVNRLIAGEIDSINIEKRYVRPDGSVLWAQLTTSRAFDAAGQPTHLVSQVLDITQRKRDAARLEAHACEQEALRSLATLVASESQPRMVFAAAAERVAEVLEADFGGVTRLEPTGEARLVGSWSAAGFPEARIGSLIDLSAPTALSATLRTGAPANLSRYVEPLDHPPIPVRSGLAAPIEVNGSVWGAVSVGWADEGAADAEADQRIARIAHLVSLAVSGAEAREQLSRLASTDHLTGLYNQRAFSDRLANEVARARRHNRPVSLVVLDLDHFKLVNDTHGHDAGNRALAEFAGRLLAVRRSGEVLARVGGEEFAWILPETTGEDALGAAERARRAIEDTPFEGIGTLTTSAGVCALEDAADASELFRHADLALYWAKANGRNLATRYAATELSLVTANEQTKRLERARALAAIRALAAAVDAKDPSTQRHSERVASLAAELARAAGWTEDRIALLTDAALVHDVGKIAIPDQLLLKPASLTPAEYGQIQTHSALGAQMLDDLLHPEQVTWIRHHHERYDGHGYPHGLAGEDIPEGARLLATADAWDAMTAERSYCSARTLDGALHEMTSCAGTQFCPTTIDLLTKLRVQGRLT